MNLPDDLLTCRDVYCLLHRPVIERLHNDIIAALFNAAKCSIQFSTAKRNNNKSSRSGCKEHVAMYRAEAMNWHALWSSCGCPREGYVFNMGKATRSTYHKQIKYIEQNEDMIHKDRFSNELLSKDMSQFWRSVTDFIGKSKRTSNIIDDFSNDNDVSEYVARSYENVFNQMGFNCSDMN